MTPDDLENLERWCDGTLVGEALTAWTARVARDPSLQAEIASERRFVNHLRAIATPDAERSSAAQAAAVRTHSLIVADRQSSRSHTVAQIMAGTRPTPWIRWWPIAASATAACLAVALWLTTGGSPTSTAVAWGDGAALRAGADVPPTVHDVRFADRSAVAVAPNSRLRLGDDAQRKRVELLAGGVEANVAPQTADTSFAITTPHGEATVLGTHFRVDLADDCTVVTVSEGRVAVHGGTTTLATTAGQRAIAADHTVFLAPPPWADHRPLGRVVLSGMMGPPGKQPASNPQGWLFDGAIDLRPAGFAERMTAAVDQMIVGLRAAGAQGLVLYAIEGGVHHHTAGFLGDPRRVGEFAPEFDAIADQLFARIRAAGFSCGVTLSPWRLERDGATWHKSTDTSALASELEDKLTYAQKRWGCTVFYVNVQAPGIPEDALIPSAALRTVALRHPDVLLIAENATIAHTAVAAGQALRDAVVPPGRTVVRLPWFGANPTPAVLAAARANGDVLMFDPLVSIQVDALRASAQRLPPP